MSQDRDEFDREWPKSFKDFWKPLLQIKGIWNERKIKNEIHDLAFVLDQISIVYCTLTGGKLSKASYYADTIISEYEDQLSKAYDRGYEDCITEKLADKIKNAEYDTKYAVLCNLIIKYKQIDELNNREFIDIEDLEKEIDKLNIAGKKDD